MFCSQVAEIPFNGETSAQWQAAEVPKGIYMYEIYENFKKINTGKVVLQ